MKTPSLEEVKERFKNAKEVRCNEFLKKEDNKIFEIDIDSIYELSPSQIVCKDAKRSTSYVSIFYRGKYAEIISYKEKNYQLSETQVNELIKEPNIKDFFIREGIIENDKLEVGKWYKSKYGCLKFFVDHKNTYGFDNNMRYINLEGGFNLNCDFQNWTLATPQEVETALINEAKKRGYKQGIRYKTVRKGNNTATFQFLNHLKYYSDDNSLTDGWGGCIFKEGVWAEIIDETIEIKKSVILNTPNDLELGKLIRKML